MVGFKPKVKKRRKTGGLSTREKLASKNPAARAEGRRELAGRSAGERQSIVKEAKGLTRRKGFVGLAKPSEVRQATQKDKDFTSKARRQDVKRFPAQRSPTQQTNNPLLDRTLSPSADAELNKFNDEVQPIQQEEKFATGLDLFEKELAGTATKEELLRRQERLEGATLGGLAAAAFIVPLPTVTPRSIANTMGEVVKAAKSLGNAATSTKAQQAAAGISQKAINKAVRQIQIREIAMNTVNAAKTQNIFLRIYQNKVVRGTLIAGAAAVSLAKFGMDVMGQYLFGSFVNEESSQVAGFDYSTNFAAKNYEAAEEALIQREAILDTKAYSDIRSLITQKKARVAFDNFFTSERIKLEHDKVNLKKAKEKAAEDRKKLAAARNQTKTNTTTTKKKPTKTTKEPKETDEEIAERARVISGTSKKVKPSRFG